MKSVTQSAHDERETQKLKSSLRRKERAIAALRARIEERELIFVSSLADKDRQIHALSQEVSEKSKELDHVTSTLGWRILNRYGPVKYGVVLPILRALGLKRTLPSEHDGLRFHINKGLPDRVSVGKGTAIEIAGWCYHPLYEVKRVQLSLNGSLLPMKASRMPMPDVLRANFPDRDPKGRSYRSGFWSLLPLPEIGRTTQVSLEIHARLSNGETCSQIAGTAILEPANHIPSSVFSFSGTQTDEALVAICMTTYNPPTRLFERQIQSIINQTHSRWVCIISDDGSRPEVYEDIRRIVARDKRFYVRRNPSTLGFYRNFERCLSLTPEEAQFVALSDHDDYWHPDKISTLLARFDADTSLVYSDMNIVDDKGSRIADTYWTTRRNNYENFASLIFANTITGAASMIPRKLLRYVLPFPQRIGEAYHDHWIACVAKATGRVKYIDRPLYDYVQHSSNVLGHYAPTKRTIIQRLANVFSALGNPAKVIRENLDLWGSIYFHDLLRLQLICRVLLLRCGSELTGAKKKILGRICTIDESCFALAWLWIRGLRNVGRPSETLGAENRLFRAAIWKKQRTLASRLSWLVFPRSSAEKGAPETAQMKLESSGDAPDSMTPEADPLSASQTVVDEGDSPSEPNPDDGDILIEASPLLHVVEVIRQKIDPLRLRVSPSNYRRINLLIPTLDPKYVFGGYITKFNLAGQLAAAGFDVRILTVDYCEYQPSQWAQQLQGFAGLYTLFQEVEGVNGFDRSIPLEVSPDDVFIATTWWTAHIAHQAAKALGKQRFLYLIQEYEPFTFPMGTFASLSEQTYSFPHYAVFSTELLRDYFRQNALGVFANGHQTGEADSISFQNTITSVGEVALNDISERSPKKLLLYARPEPHAARNMFEMAILAISAAINAGYFRGDWEFFGIGTVGLSDLVPLSEGISMQLLPRKSQDDYREVLRAHDLGVSLMYTPHPGLVPIEMAAAGMLVVTNTYANKTADKLRAISNNIIAAPPTVEDLTLALKEAASHIEDYSRRVRGSHVAWSTTWSQSFDTEVWNAIERFIDAAH